MEADIQALQQQMKKVEQIFVRYGAEPQDINRHNREVLGLRQEYLYRGNYYRVDHAAFDGIPYLIINQIDDPRYAADNYRKLMKYYNHGFVLGKNLIVSFDRCGTIDMKLIDFIIQNEIIPRL